MCKSPTKSFNESKIRSSACSFFIGILLSIYSLFFVSFRIGELIPLVRFYPTQCASAFIGTVVLQRSVLGRTAKRVVHLSTLFVLIYIIDSYVTKPLPFANGTHGNRTVVITGANSGVGYETARQLAITYGMTVIMGCRSMSKCKNAADTINSEIASKSNEHGISDGYAIPLIIDLSNFQSVKSFVHQLEEKNVIVDILFNNAGFVPGANLPVNDLRVVNTSSGTHHLCALPFALPKTILDLLPVPQNPACVDEDFLINGIKSETDKAAYIQAKIANVMHVVELPRKHSQSTSVAIDLGWVGTSIQPFMQGNLTPAGAGWMRSTSTGILPVLHAILSTNEDLMKELGNGRTWAEGGIVMNVFGKPEEAFSYPWWTDKGLSATDVSRRRMLELSGKLWDKSLGLVKQ
eukprot:g2675.t1 g2675   contig12:587888-589185(-)